MTELTKEYVELLCDTPKVIREDLVWRPQNNSQRLTARVLAPAINVQLELRAVLGKTHHSFSLLFERVTIRRYDHSHTPHRNSDGTRIDEPHKHIHNGRHYRDAYVPTDIDPAANVNEQLLCFLGEVNIDLEGYYQHLLVEGAT